MPGGSCELPNPTHLRLLWFLTVLPVSSNVPETDYFLAATTERTPSLDQAAPHNCLVIVGERPILIIWTSEKLMRVWAQVTAGIAAVISPYSLIIFLMDAAEFGMNLKASAIFFW